MRLIFCADYWDKLSADSAYEIEVSIGEKLHLSYSLINFEMLVEQQNASHATGRLTHNLAAIHQDDLTSVKASGGRCQEKRSVQNILWQAPAL